MINYVIHSLLNLVYIWTHITNLKSWMKTNICNNFLLCANILDFFKLQEVDSTDDTVSKFAQLSFSQIKQLQHSSCLQFCYEKIA